MNASLIKPLDPAAHLEETQTGYNGTLGCSQQKPERGKFTRSAGLGSPKYQLFRKERDGWDPLDRTFRPSNETARRSCGVRGDARTGVQGRWSWLECRNSASRYIYANSSSCLFSLIFCTFFFSFFKKMLKGTQAFHAVPAEQGSTALWLETECPLA